MRKYIIKIISIFITIILLLAVFTNCQNYRSEQEAAVTTVESTQQEPPQNGYTVYVSRNGIIHKNPKCSGMQYYIEMGYYDAVEAGYIHCKHCYKEQ